MGDATQVHTLGDIFVGVLLMFPFFGIGLLVFAGWVKKRRVARAFRKAQERTEREA